MSQPQSFLSGVQSLVARLDAYDAAVKRNMDEMVVRAGARYMQEQIVSRVPVRRGNLRSYLSAAEAVAFKQGASGLTATVGFLTPAAKKKTFYAFFVEYGTKGYTAGESRRAGKAKNGRQRFQKLKRSVPARPARPFFRPALAATSQYLKAQRGLAHLRAALEAGLSK